MRLALRTYKIFFFIAYDTLNMFSFGYFKVDLQVQ